MNCPWSSRSDIHGWPPFETLFGHPNDPTLLLSGVFAEMPFRHLGSEVFIRDGTDPVLRALREVNAEEVPPGTCRMCNGALGMDLPLRDSDYRVVKISSKGPKLPFLKIAKLQRGTKTPLRNRNFFPTTLTKNRNKQIENEKSAVALTGTKNNDKTQQTCFPIARFVVVVCCRGSGLPPFPHSYSRKRGKFLRHYSP